MLVACIERGAWGKVGCQTADIAELENLDIWMIPRDRAETDERFLQLIPYVVVNTCGTLVAGYRRAGAETRLSGLYSIGIGGHTELSDLVVEDGEINPVETLFHCAEREAREELHHTGPLSALDYIDIQQTIFTDASPVDRVHLGIVMYATNRKPIANPEIEEIDISAAYPGPEFEDWSNLVLSRF